MIFLFQKEYNLLTSAVFLILHLQIMLKNIYWLLLIIKGMVMAANTLNSSAPYENECGMLCSGTQKPDSKRLK